MQLQGEPLFTQRESGVELSCNQGAPMNQEQFGQFWTQLKAPLKAEWPKLTDEDLTEINGDLERFHKVVHTRYGEEQKKDVYTWANRRYSHWTGNYVGYKDPARKSE
jgi:uncharacterized protein YjbJ (UPF0337 family)